MWVQVWNSLLFLSSISLRRVIPENCFFGSNPIELNEIFVRFDSNWTQSQSKDSKQGV